MRILKYDPEKKPSILAEALVVLMSGGTVVYPTETAYALGADFFSPSAYKKIYSIKSRGDNKPLPVIVPDIRYAETLVRFTPRSSELAQQYWPGPMTLVLPFIYSRDWPHHKDSNLALRVSSNPLAENLSRSFGKPIISTSANLSGNTAPYSADEVVTHFAHNNIQPDLIIDAGVLPHVPPSTIIADDGKELKVLRKGSVEITI